jgi:hypothetical protein
LIPFNASPAKLLRTLAQADIKKRIGKSLTAEEFQVFFHHGQENVVNLPS